MRYRVRATKAALADADGIRAWNAEAGAPATAKRFVERLLQVLGSLAQHPKRCRVAPESAHFQGLEIRQKLFGVYRVLLTVIGRDVVVLHIRHGSRRYASEAELRQALDELDDTP